jgi:hypothetical protein
MIDMATLGVVPLAAMAWLNFAICGAIGWACVCRVAMMTARTTKLRFRVGYTAMMVASSASGLSPVLWGEWPGPGQISMGLAALYVIGWGASNWRGGLPSYARRDRP